MIIILYLVPKSIKKKKLFSYVWLHHEKYKRKSNIIKIHQKFWYFKIIFNLYMIEGTKWNEYEKIYKNNLLNLNLFFYFPSFFIFYFLLFFFIFFPLHFLLLLLLLLLFLFFTLFKLKNNRHIIFDLIPWQSC